MEKNKIFNLDIKLISDSLNSINSDTFYSLLNDCYLAILSGNNIISTGLGKNVPICEKFVGTLNSLSIKSQFINTNSAMHGDLGIIRENDIIIVLSKSGMSSETILLYERLLSKKNIKIWFITANQSSPIVSRNKNNLIFELNHEGDKWNLIPNNSSTIFLIILQRIAILLSSKLNIPLSTFKDNHPGGHIGYLLNEDK